MQFIFAIVIALIIYYLQSYLYEHYWKQQLSVSIRYDRPYASIGETVSLLEEIENRKPLPLPVLYVKFHSSRTFLYDNQEGAAMSDYYYRNDAFSILGNQRITRSLSFRTTTRGHFVIDTIDLVSCDLFMQKSHAAQLSNHAGLYVYPKRLRRPEAFTLTSSILGELVATSLYEDPLSYQGIREYFPGDGLRTVNWKATAKNNQLMVNTFYHTNNYEVTLLVNLDCNTIQRSDTLREYIICVATTFLYALEEKGFAFRLAVNLTDSATNCPITTSLGTGKQHMHLLLQALSALDLSNEMTDFLAFLQDNSPYVSTEQTKAATILLSNYRKAPLMELVQKRKEEQHTIYFVCPEYKNAMQDIPGIHYWEVLPSEI